VPTVQPYVMDAAGWCFVRINPEALVHVCAFVVI